MDSLLNPNRPPVFCPGCAHERVVHALDKAFSKLGLAGNRIALVSDIGCSGLFDTFFNTHAFHGLHGRALTYASGLKMARPDLRVVVTMGDGGLGIGGAHLLSACRRNLDISLLVLNNFNYGMTGGQCSATTPPTARVGSGFLNQLEKPLDICQVAGAAGAAWLKRASAYQTDLPELLAEAVSFDGFSLIDIHGVCPGRYSRRNSLSPKDIAASLERLPPIEELARGNQRQEYASHYQELAATQAVIEAPEAVEPRYPPRFSGRKAILFLGRAGQRVVTAAEILGLAGMAGGLHASQKSDYPITVLRGHSVSELVLSDAPVEYTGIEQPDIAIALAPEGVARRKSQLEKLNADARVIQEQSVSVPDSPGCRMKLDFKGQGIRSRDWALASLAVLAAQGEILGPETLEAGLRARFSGQVLETAIQLVCQVYEMIDRQPD